jgi:hypothetical protein
VTILPFCRRVKVLQTCIMAAAYTIAWIIGIVACFFPLQQIIVCLRMPMTSRRLLHCGQRRVWLQQSDWELCYFRTSCGRERADTRVLRLASVPETERFNLAPEPGDIKFYLQWSHRRVSQRHLQDIKLECRVREQFVHRCWYFIAGCSKVNRESAGVKPCIAFRCVSVLIRVRAVCFRLSNSRMFIMQDYDVVCDLFCRS